MRFGNIKCKCIVIKKVSPCKYQLKCHYKCLCFDQIFHICLFFFFNAANSALCSPPVDGRGKMEEQGGIQIALLCCMANKLFTLGRQNGLFAPNEYVLSGEDEKCWLKYT